MSKDPNIQQHATDLEEAVLGMAIGDAEAAIEVAAELKPEHFFDRRNRAIMLAITELVAEGTPVDLITVQNELTRLGELDEAGGRFRIADLSVEHAGMPASNIAHHAAIIKEKHIMRQIGRIGNRMREVANDTSRDAFETLDVVQDSIIRLGGDQMRGDKKANALTTPFMTRIEEVTEKRRDGEDVVTGIPSGFDKSDELTMGWQDGDFIIIAARPSMGKTAMALDLVKNAGKKGYGAAIYSLEMGKEQVIQRLIGAEARVNIQKARRGYASNQELSKLRTAKAEIDKLNLYINDTPSVTVMAIKASARRLVQNHGVRLIVVDYLQLINGSGENANQRMQKISRQLKLVAKELGVPVIALSQLSRAVEQRGGDKRPQLSDLRDSGALEQDADLVYFLYRPEYYGITEHDYLGCSTEGLAEFILAKQRNGPLGTVYLTFLEEYATFENRAITQNDRRSGMPPAAPTKKTKNTTQSASNGSVLFDPDAFGSDDNDDNDAPF